VHGDIKASFDKNFMYKKVVKKVADSFFFSAGRRLADARLLGVSYENVL